MNGQLWEMKWPFQPGFLRLLQQVSTRWCKTKNLITEKQNSLKWVVLPECTACKVVSLLNYFALVCTAVQGSCGVTAYREHSFNFPVKLFSQSQDLIKVWSNRKHLQKHYSRESRQRGKPFRSIWYVSTLHSPRQTSPPWKTGLLRLLADEPVLF